MKKTIFSLIMLLSLAFNLAQSQENSTFKPSGKVTARGFLNVNSGLSDNNNGVSFDISRAYLGYQYQLTPYLKAQVVGDFASGKSGVGQLTPILKNAFIQWKKQNITVSGGLIGLYQFREQESYWGHRYIYKSFQDNNKFGHSADVGLSLKYRVLSPLSVDFSVTNGEGYKRIQQNKSMRYQLGVSLTPINHFLVRIYADIYNDSRSIHPKNLPTYDVFDNQYTYVAFVGYKNNRVKAGVEYNRQINHQLIKDRNLSGYSAYCTLKLGEQWSTFARFDWLESSKEQGKIWNRRDGKTAIVGAEYKLHKNIKFAPNLRYNHNDKTTKNNYEVYINVEFRI